ncbi:hypothetical protein Syun_016651 [Stephania yunnanensis]|uniref:Uncharacterized protein n=1 Tax=Stephania yunnanensis TaxID=152371 RepID=A0AAP0P2N1_9MAGN
MNWVQKTCFVTYHDSAVTQSLRSTRLGLSSSTTISRKVVSPGNEGLLPQLHDHPNYVGHQNIPNTILILITSASH